MECLFPKPGGPSCCEKDRQFRSCNPILAKTVHRSQAWRLDLYLYFKQAKRLHDVSIYHITDHQH